MQIDSKIIQNANGRFSAMQTERNSWFQHWQQLADYMLPRRYRWLVTANQWNRGSPVNTLIIDSTATIAARTCASGMMSGITSPTRPWFKLQIAGFTLNDDSNPVSLWLAECESRMRRVFAESNFYNSIAIMYHDLVVFGSAAMLVYEDYDDVIRCQNPCLGEFYFANGPRGNVETFGREFTYTIDQAVKRFGKENCPTAVQNAYEQGGASLSREIVIRHLIEKNDPPIKGIPKKFKWRELYWVKGAGNAEALELKGFNEWPGLCPRWDVSGNDSYGYCPGMDALGDTKQLQQEQKRKSQAIDKMVNPPMVGDVQLKNRPASVLPGGVTFVSGQSQVGFKPAYQITPQINELMLDIQEVQNRIRTIFFNDLFMMISQLNTVRSATEIDARREEKLIALGPVLERFENEALDPVITRTFGIMSRGGLLPPPPPEIEGADIQIQYVSMLAEAQRASSTMAIERILSLVGNMVAVDQEVVDVVNFDEAVNEYAGYLSVSPKMIRSKEEVMARRQNRQVQLQQEQMLQQSYGAAKGAEILSKTDMGGGQNALAAIMGGMGG